MIDDDLRRIEKAIARPLPDAVRRFFLGYPTELRTTVRDMGTDQDGQPYRECAADNELVDNADAILALNTPSPTGFLLLGWTPRMLIVGNDGCGASYWIDLDAEGCPVYRVEAGQEVQNSDRVADSLEDFAQGLIRSYRDFSVDDH